MKKRKIITGWGWAPTLTRRKRLRKKLRRRGFIRVIKAGPPDAKWVRWCSRERAVCRFCGADVLISAEAAMSGCWVICKKCRAGGV